MQEQSPLHTEMAQLNIDNKTTTRSTPSSGPIGETADQRMIRELQARVQQSEARLHQYENPFQYDVPKQDEQDYQRCVDLIGKILSDVNTLSNMGDRLGGMVVDKSYDVNRNHTDKGASRVDGITRNHVYEIRQSLDNLKLRVLPTLQNDITITAKARFRREAINHKVNIVNGRRLMENQINQQHQRQLAIARGRLLPSVSFPVHSFSTSLSTSSSSSSSSAGLYYTPTSSAQPFGCMVQGPLGGEEPPNSISLGGAREDMRDALADHRLGQRQYQSRLRNTTVTRGEQQNDETDGHRSSASNKN